MTIWSEDWTGQKANATPSSINSMYSQNNLGTQIYNNSTAGGKAPELLLKQNDKWTIKISDLKGCSGEFTLSFHTNKIPIKASPITVSANGNSIKLSVDKSDKKLCTGTFSVKDGVSNITIVFLNTESNSRIDDIVLTGTKAQTKPVTSLSIFGQPTKTTYNEGELFDPAGIKVMALYEGETDQVDVTSSATFDYDKTPLVVGTTQMEVKASYKEKVAAQTFDITVNELPKYDITATAAVGGSYTVKIGEGVDVTVPAEGATYKSIEGNNVVMTIAAADGYKQQSTPFDVETDDNKTVSVSKSGTSYSFTMPAKAVTITAKFSKLYNITKGVCEHGTITIENSNTEVSQAVKGNKIVVTATPDEHYDLSGMYYVVSGSDEHISISGNSFTMPENDVTVYATFAEKAKYQVTWMTNGTEAKKELVYSDATVGSEAPEVAKVEGYSFMGWTTTALAEATDVAPVYVSLTDNKFMPEADVTLYAVYAVVAEGGTKECTSTLTFNEGTVSSPYENAGATWTFGNCTFKTNNAVGFGKNPNAYATVKLPQGAIAKKFVISAGSTWSPYALIKLLGANGNLIKESKTAFSYDFTSSDNAEGTYTLKNASSNSAWIKSIAITFDATAYTYSGYCTTVEAVAEPTYTAQTLTFIAHVDADYYATFSNDKVVFMPENVTSKTVAVETGKITFTTNVEGVFGEPATVNVEGSKVIGYYIPANTGVLLESKDKTVTYYTVDNIGNTGYLDEFNMLQPAPTNGGAFNAEPGYEYFKLAYDDLATEKDLGFYWGAPEGGAFYVKAGTAYLAVPETNVAGAKGFTLSGEATGIEGVNANVENAKAIYNLNGQRVASMAKPGLYIVNGKKMVVRK